MALHACTDVFDFVFLQSHAGKVVERHWYEKNKHIFPASRWEVRIYLCGCVCTYVYMYVCGYLDV